jgi:hypothetical protein
VQANDKISVQDFDFYFDSKDDIVLTNIKDKDGNTIDFSSIIIILPALLMVWVETTTPSLRKSTIDPLILLTIA